MASTTFIDNQTVIYAAWLNDVNNVVYNGIFQSSSITATSMICNGTASGAGFTNLINNTFTAPGPIGSVTPSTGAFTTLSATSLTLTNKLPVAQGGTGLATLTANNVILGNGTSTPSFVAPSTLGNVLTSNGTTWASTTPILSKSFTSSNQSIPTTASQAFTVAHGMGITPKILRLVAVCLTATAGWTVGAEGEVLINGTSNGNIQSFGLFADATNVYYDSGSAIITINFSSGDYVNILNNSNFALKIYAFA